MYKLQKLMVMVLILVMGLLVVPVFSENATVVSYTLSPAPSPDYPDSTGFELTDGVLAGNTYTDPAQVGFLSLTIGGPKPTITLDLGGIQPVSGVRGYFLSGLYGYTYPSDVSVSTSLDGTNWSASTATTGPPDTGVWQSSWITVSLPVTNARYVKMVITRSTDASLYYAHVMISEVSVVNYIDLSMVNYTLNPAPSPTYPDSTGFELTDGVLAGSTYTDPAQVGFLSLTIGGTKPEIILDLGMVQAIVGVRGYFMSGADGWTYPSNIEVSTSLDGTNWSASTAKTGPPDTGVWQSSWITVSLPVTNARYVKMVITRSTDANLYYAHVMTSEISVVNYYLNPAPSPSYPDSTGFELTDGVLAGNTYTDPNQVGFLSLTIGGPNPTITLDLGMVQAIIGVKGYFMSGADGWTYPSNIEVSTSLDGTNWSASTAKTGPPDTGVWQSSWITVSLPAVNARYVKIVITRSTDASLYYAHVMTSEIEVDTLISDTVRVKDTFTRANNTIIGNTEIGGYTWYEAIPPADDWTITNNNLYCNGRSYVCPQEYISTNVNINVDLKQEWTDAYPGRWAGIGYRRAKVRDNYDTSGYTVYLHPDWSTGIDIRLYNPVDGNFATADVGTSYDTQKYYNLKVVAVGNSHKVYFDGKLVIDVTNNYSTKPGYVQLVNRDQPTYFDNFEVSANNELHYRKSDEISSSPNGIAVWGGNNTRTADILREAGSKWVRDEIRWSNVEQYEGQYNFNIGNMSDGVDRLLQWKIEPVGYIAEAHNGNVIQYRDANNNPANVMYAGIGRTEDTVHYNWNEYNVDIPYRDQWSIINNQLQNTGAGAYSAVSPVATNEVRVQYKPTNIDLTVSIKQDVSTDLDRSIGVGYRRQKYDDMHTGSGFTVFVKSSSSTADDITLYSAGSQSVIGSANITGGINWSVMHTLRIVVSGTSHKVYFDNKLKINVTNTYLSTTPGYVHLFARYNKGTFDDLTIKNPTSGIVELADTFTRNNTQRMWSKWQNYLKYPDGVSGALQYFNNRIKYWSIVNEPEGGYWSNPLSCLDDWPNYVMFTQDTSSLIKTFNPSLKVMNDHGPISPQTDPYLDFVTRHGYRANGTPEGGNYNGFPDDGLYKSYEDELTHFRSLTTLPLWETELCWTPRQWGGFYPTDLNQRITGVAKYLSRLYVLNRGLGVPVTNGWFTDWWLTGNSDGTTTPAVRDEVSVLTEESPFMIGPPYTYSQEFYALRCIDTVFNSNVKVADDITLSNFTTNPDSGTYINCTGTGNSPFPPNAAPYYSHLSFNGANTCTWYLEPPLGQGKRSSRLYKFKDTVNKKIFIAFWFDLKGNVGLPEGQANLTVNNVLVKNPVLINMLDGTLQDISANRTYNSTVGTTFTGLPIRDYPLIISGDYK